MSVAVLTTTSYAVKILGPLFGAALVFQKIEQRQGRNQGKEN